MADEIENPITPPAASTAEVASSPSAETVVTEPVETTGTTDINPEMEKSTSATPIEKTEEVKPETLLGAEKKPEEVKSEEKVSEVKEGETPAEVKEEIPAVVPEYEAFTLPEGVSFDAEKMGDFTKMLGEFETTAKASHEEVQKLGQQMVDRHIAELQRYTDSLTQAWNKQKNDWKESFLKDPEFANRTDTVVNSAIDAIGIYGGDVKQQDEFRSLMESSGVGNHPAMIRLLSNIMTAKAEPKQLAAPQIGSSEKISKMQKMYGKKS